MSRPLADVLIDDLNRRNNRQAKAQASAAIDRMLSRLFPEQLEFVLDRSRFTSALCPRRSGKTYACTVKLLRTALLMPGANCLYLTLTRGQAMKNIWTPLKTLNEQFELGAKFHGTNLAMTLPNGSTIQLSGAETRQEIDKLRGQSFDSVIIDECKSFNPAVFAELLEEVLGPALNDRLGSLAIIGTPGNVLAGPFYDATTGSHPGWSFHEWSVSDNVALPHLWEACLEEKARHGWADDDPRWIREYLGRWCPSDDVLVYNYSSERNAYDGQLPEGHAWKYLLGLDLGFSDPVAICVAAYSDTCPTLYHVWDFKSPGLTIEGVALAVREAIQKFGQMSAMVLDRGSSGGKTMQASLSEMYGLHFEPAEKHDKFDYIDLLNSDLVSGKVRIKSGSHLESEMTFLQWADKRKLKEDPQLENHACDAFLYLWRYAYHHFFEPAGVKPQPGSPQWHILREQESLEALVAARRAKRDLSFAEVLAGELDLEDPWN